MDATETVYPRLPHILDEEMLASLATLESREKTFARSRGGRRQNYLRALYLKAFRALGYGHLQPADLPRQLRVRIAEQLGGATDLPEIRTIDRRERSRILGEVRAFLQIRASSPAARKDVETWLAEGPARREGDVAALSNAAIERFRESSIELPSLENISALAHRALASTNKAIVNAINDALDPVHGTKLVSLVNGKAPGVLEAFKKPPGAASSNALHRELLRLKDLGAFMPNASALALVSRRKMQELATVARRYDISELRDLRPARRRAALACFVAVRRSEMLDDLAEMFIRTWEQTKANAARHADAVALAVQQEREHQWGRLRDLVHVIRTSRTPTDLWGAIHAHDEEYYEHLWEQMVAQPTRTGSYYDKLEDHYTSLRRFLPDWYALMPLASTTADDTLVQAREFLRLHSKPTDRELPVRGALTRFLSRSWESRALRRYRNTGELLRVTKAPYELGWTNAAADALKTGALAVPGAIRYAAITDHLLDRQAFLDDYSATVAKLQLPETAADHYKPRRKQLKKKLQVFDAQYDKLKGQFWMNRDGTLGFSRTPGQKIPRRAKKLSAALMQYMPEATILDVLLDCHRWTGFMDAFQPLSGRQNMRDAEKIRQVLTALYAYGCNCGPTQAARATGLNKSQVIYIRRHYMATKRLIDATSMLAVAYGRTSIAQRLDHPRVLLCDAMHVRTQEQSLTARTYYRDLSHKSVLLYQHVTPHCICRFTQALLCNVSEAIHMLHGVTQCRQGQEPIICICDSGGKSDLVFGLASLLNILLYPRVRSGNLKLWAPVKDMGCSGLEGGFAGVIRLDWIDEGWRDMMWILASIEAGTASPDLIFGRLASQPKHPATRGFQELGKLERSLYLLRYGMEMDLRRFVVPHTARREHWNQFAREVLAFGDLLREKGQADQEEVFWFLTVVQNAIVLWNALALDKAITTAKRVGVVITDRDLKHVLPTMTGHINFVGRFDLDLRRRPPFKFATERT